MKADAKKFRVSSNKRNSAAGVLLGGFIFTLLIENAVTDIDKNTVPCLIIAVIVGLVAAILCIIFVKEYYMQIHDDGFELIKGKKVTRYSFSDFAGSNVTRHYMNGIYTGTSREISIMEASGKTRKINANNLSRSTFAELVTYLGQARFTGSHDIEATAEYFKNGIEFRIPADEMVKANKNKFIRWSILTVALFVTFIGMLIYYLITKMDSAGFLTALIFAGLGGAVVLFLDTIPSGILYRKMKNLPKRIFVDEYSLVIDDKTLSSGNILNILMVPASYEILTRDVTVVTKDNMKLKYNFGKKDLKATKDTYSDYDKLCSALELWCIVNHINFMQILG